MYKAKISGTGSYLPEKLLTNKDLEKIVDTSDEWIYERTGMRSRRVADPGLGTSDLALIASQRALEAANLKPKDVDLIILATVLADQPIPTGSCFLQTKLGCQGVPAFDLGAACSGFVYAVAVANQFIKTGLYKNIVVSGAELLTRIVNYQDRETCILFGDAAGAVIVSRNEDPNDPSEILSEHLHADGQLSDLFETIAGGTKMPLTDEIFANPDLRYMKMKGREIFKHAVRTISKSCEEALEKNNMKKENVDWIIPHQANIRILEGVAKQLGVSMEKVICCIEDMGNTSAATIPVALDLAVRDGRIQRGQHLILTAFGAGLTSGSVMIRW